MYNAIKTLWFSFNEQWLQAQKPYNIYCTLETYNIHLFPVVSLNFLFGKLKEKVFLKIVLFNNKGVEISHVSICEHHNTTIIK